MPNEETKGRFARVAKLFAAYGVEYIVIGGVAESLMGSPRPTFDIDLCHRRTPENLKRLAKALKELHPTLRGAPPDLPFILDAKSLALGNNFMFQTDVEALDLLGHVEPIGDYEALLDRAEVVDFVGESIKIISIDDLIRVKEHINRPKDQDSLFQLRAIKQVREEQGGRG
ncbi:MAG: hypothetical protein ACE37H_13070 [Phycisphaeraceae bacterium]